jgi:hypothetical protein
MQTIEIPALAGVWARTFSLLRKFYWRSPGAKTKLTQEHVSRPLPIADSKKQQLVMNLCCRITKPHPAVPSGTT